MRRFISLILFILFSPASSQAERPVRIHIFLSVDWEGDTLRESNLQSMARFNREFPEYPVIHFLNAAYYTKNWELTEEEVTNKIRSAVKANDEFGVHIHAWENFVRESGVEYRAGPSFWNSATSLGRQGEYGDDVPLNTYNTDEIRKMLHYSRAKLQEHGFNDLVSFRGGGWMSGPKVFEALVQEGFQVDSSAVPVEMVENLYPDTLLAQINRQQWPGVEATSFPYHQNGQLLQFPNNAGLADYLDEEEFFQVYLKNIEEAKRRGSSDVYLHFGWHQESAVEYFEHTKTGDMELKKVNFLDRVREGLKKIEAHSRAHHYEIHPQGFQTFPKHLISPSVPGPRPSCQVLLNGLAL